MGKTSLRALVIVTIFLTGFVYLVFGSPALSNAARPESVVESPSYLRIFYYRDGKVAQASLFAHSRSIDILAPQSYSLDGDAILNGGVNSKVLSFARSHDVTIMPVVTNKGFGQDSLEAILNDETKQDSAIAALVAEAKNQKYFGWQIDFEQMDISYREKYSSFIKKAHEAMQKQNLLLSVAVVAQVSSNPADYPNNLWTKLIGVYDYAALASSTDFITIMAFDDPLSSGPVARYSWIEQVLKYSLQFIPKEKLSLGIPLYYWKWDDDIGKRVGIGGYEGIKNVLKIPNMISYDFEMQAPFIRYIVSGSHYTLWYDNAQSIKKKLELVTKYGLQGFSAWALGLEVPSVYNSIR